MNRREFVKIRHRSGKTQVQLARLLGVSVKAIQSCEQGWRKIPLHSERQLLLLLALNHSRAGKNSPCWLKKGCPVENRENCPAWASRRRQIVLVADQWHDL